MSDENDKGQASLLDQIRQSRTLKPVSNRVLGEAPNPQGITGSLNKKLDAALGNNEINAENAISKRISNITTETSDEKIVKIIEDIGDAIDIDKKALIANIGLQFKSLKRSVPSPDSPIFSAAEDVLDWDDNVAQLLKGENPEQIVDKVEPGKERVADQERSSEGTPDRDINQNEESAPQPVEDSQQRKSHANKKPQTAAEVLAQALSKRRQAMVGDEDEVDVNEQETNTQAQQSKVSLNAAPSRTIVPESHLLEDIQEHNAQPSIDTPNVANSTFEPITPSAIQELSDEQPLPPPSREELEEMTQALVNEAEMPAPPPSAELEEMTQVLENDEQPLPLPSPEELEKMTQALVNDEPMPDPPSPDVLNEMAGNLNKGFDMKGAIAKYLQSASPEKLAIDIDRNLKKNGIWYDSLKQNMEQSQAESKEIFPAEILEKMEKVGAVLEARKGDRANNFGSFKQKIGNGAAIIANAFKKLFGKKIDNPELKAACEESQSLLKQLRENKDQAPPETVETSQAQQKGRFTQRHEEHEHSQSQLPQAPSQER